MSKYALATLIALIFTTHLEAQRTIKGKITEALTGLPLPGARVVVEGFSTVQTTSDKNGMYVLRLPTHADHLLVSHPAFREKRVAVLSSGVLNVSMSAELSIFKVKGTVVDASTGKPITGAKLTYLRSKSTTYSDERGAFSTPVAARSAVFSISCEGYQPLTRTLETDQPNTLRLDPLGKKSTPSLAVSTPNVSKNSPPATYNSPSQTPERKPKTADSMPVSEKKEKENEAAKLQPELPWWQQAQYGVPILVALIGGLFSLLQTWLTNRK